MRLCHLFALGISVGTIGSASQSLAWRIGQPATVCRPVNHQIAFSSLDGRVLNTSTVLNEKFNCPMVETSTTRHINVTYAEVQVETASSGTPFATAVACIVGPSGAQMCGTPSTYTGVGNTYPLTPGLTAWADTTYQWWGAHIQVTVSPNSSIRSVSMVGS